MSPERSATSPAANMLEQTELRLLKILVVEDDEPCRMLLCALIAALGHEVISAADGTAGLALFEAHQPDIVLTDLMMPGMDGFGLLDAIRRLSTRRWVPVIFITGSDERDSSGKSQAVVSLERGADDFISKPIQADNLRARIRAYARAIAMQDSLEAQRCALQEYQTKAEEEKRFARDLMQLLSRSGQTHDPLVRQYCKPTEDLSGDIIAVARSYSGKLHVLLADGTGHGLTAALNVLPMVEPFYAMTAKGYSIQTVLAELNTKLYNTLPPECYVAAAMVAYDSVAGVLEVWNGGLPDLIFRDLENGSIRRFRSSSLPLGILQPAFMDITPSTVKLAHPGQLAMMSDGLVEVMGANDLDLGLVRVTEALQQFSTAEELIEHVRSHYHDNYLDDLTIVAIDCKLEGTARSSDPQAARQELSNVCLLKPAASWRLELNLGPQEVRTVDAVPLLHDFLRNLGVGRKSMGHAFLVLSELINNAIDHGLLQLSTESKNKSEDMEAYYDLRDLRLTQLEHGNVKIMVTPVLEEGEPILEFLVADSGLGFDVGATQPLTQHSRGGRGLRLVRELCKSLEFRGTGNVAVARMRLEQDESETA